MELETEDGMKLLLRRLGPEGGGARGDGVGAGDGGGARRQGPVVLLLHGASAASETFTVPVLGGTAGFAGYLLGKGYDVWALDWRGGKRFGAGERHAPEFFTMDAVARYDIPRAVDHVLEVTKAGALSIVAHCVGAATLAMAIGAGYLAPKRVRRMVLSTMGLFYSVPWDGWIKADDQALERALIDEPGTKFIHCDATRYPWPRGLEHAYTIWPEQLLPAKRYAIFRRLTFMFGRPFLEGNVPASLVEDRALLEQFGPMPMALYIHAGQNVRRGFAAPYDDMLYTPRRPDLRGRPAALRETGRYLHLERFRETDVTLITGELNRLWHRDSILRMAEWLRRDRRVRCEARVFPGYGHQDLFWGERAPHDVFDYVERAIA